MELAQAETLAGEIVGRLGDFCSQIEVAGSIRRRRPFPRDIDIVLVPKHQGQLAAAVYNLGEPVAGGPKLERRRYKGIGVDLYYATPETWATLLLIRTGSTAHNIRLTSLAKRRGWHLYANGRGLYNKRGVRVAGDTEGSIFRALGLLYKEPRERE